MLYEVITLLSVEGTCPVAGGGSGKGAAHHDKAGAGKVGDVVGAELEAGYLCVGEGRGCSGRGSYNFV